MPEGEFYLFFVVYFIVSRLVCLTLDYSKHHGGFTILDVFRSSLKSLKFLVPAVFDRFSFGSVSIYLKLKGRLERMPFGSLF